MQLAYRLRCCQGDAAADDQLLLVSPRRNQHCAARLRGSDGRSDACKGLSRANLQHLQAPNAHFNAKWPEGGLLCAGSKRATPHLCCSCRLDESAE